MNEQPSDHEADDSMSLDALSQVSAGDMSAPSEHVLHVELGDALPPADPGRAPLLTPLQSLQDEPDESLTTMHTLLADGLHFAGNAVLKGPCSVGCNVQGNLVASPGYSVSVVVTETGVVNGDITAEKISVMGQTNGILDSGRGDVVLYETASVQGLVRYGRIQVNGADLNATLERVPRG